MVSCPAVVSGEEVADATLGYNVMDGLVSLRITLFICRQGALYGSLEIIFRDLHEIETFEVRQILLMFDKASHFLLFKNIIHYHELRRFLPQEALSLIRVHWL